MIRGSLTPQSVSAACDTTLAVACPLVPGTVMVITNQFSVISDSVPSVVIMSSNNIKNNKSGEKGKKVNYIEVLMKLLFLILTFNI